MHLFLPLGDHPPANAFLTRAQLDQPEARFALDAHACLDCGLIQVPNVVPPGFFREYLYVPSASDTMHRHFGDLAARVRRDFAPSADDLVVDIGSNDGLFLWKLHEIGGRGLGIEPATNLAAVARARGVEVVNEYFDRDTVAHVRARFGRARVITTTNTFNHIDDLHGFTAAAMELLDAHGTIVIEVPHAGDLVERNEFDTIYHEHLSEFSVKSIVDLFRFFDLVVTDVERLPVHGGSMRVCGCRRSNGAASPAAVDDWLLRERVSGLLSAATYDAFAARVERIRRGLLDLLAAQNAEGLRVAGYGAPAKGNTLLNYCGIGPETVPYLADRNALKHGRYSPGMHIPIVPAEHVLEDQPDALLILAWNFADEIVQQQEEYRRRGGRFILPIPEPRIVS